MFNNPPQNTLPKNLPWDQLKESVARSGYPLQSVVAAQLKGVFAVTEEWGFPFSQDFHFGPDTVTVYTRAAPNTVFPR